MFDLKITGGLLYDGTGAPPKRSDVGLIGDTIAAVGPLADAPARETMDARGKCVCPGFVDAHSHSDMALLANPRAESQVRQGITTEVISNCGLSAAPLLGECKPHLNDLWQSYGIEQDWTTMAGYRERLQSARPSVNVVPLVGHNSVRACVMGYADRAPDAGEMERMASLVEAALDDGAFGMSSGLIYVPGCFCKTGELIELATVCARHDALYTTHMRNESDRVEEALAEALRIGRESGARVQISHLKTSGRQNWSKIDRLIGMIEQARADGLDVTADRYPYVAGWTDLDIVLPKWALDGGAEAQLARLRDPAARARMRDEILRTRGADSWGEVMVAGVRSDANKPLEGKTVAEVAAMQRKEPVDALLDLLVVEELHAGGIFFGMSEANLERFLQQPWMMIGSDSAGRAHYGVLRTGHPHPRTFGTFPRVLSAYAGKPALQVEEAIRKMTALPAKKFGLRGRGIIERGAFADLVVFDPATLRDRSTYAQPWQYPTGIETVVVNGQVTFHGGEHTNAAAGRVLGRTR